MRGHAALLPLAAVSVIAATAAGCGGAGRERMYSAGRTARCLKSHGFEVLEGPQGQTLSVRRSKSEGYELLFHPSVDDAKALDITRWNSNFGGFDFHRVRYGNVSVIWATGGVVPRRPSSSDFAAVNGCLRVAPTNYGQSS